MDKFLQALREDFHLEANELLATIELSLIELEQGVSEDTRQSLTEKIYRSTHSLKGAARSVNYPLIEQLCMSLEEVWKKLKNGEMTLQSSMYNLFHQSLDLLRLLVDSSDRPDAVARTEAMCAAIGGIEIQTKPKLMGLLDADEHELQPHHTQQSQEIILPQEEIPVDQPASAAEESMPKQRPQRDDSETVRVSLKRLNHLLTLAEELASGNSSVTFVSEELEKVFSGLSISALIHENDDRALVKRRLHEASKNINRLAGLLEKHAHELRLMTDELIYSFKQTLMFPASELFAVLPRMVRDIAAESGKQIELELEGGEVTLDKRILEGLKDPLIHLVRNCIDHGLELPMQREAAGKHAKGKLLVKMHINAEGKAELVVADDGKGIDTKALRRKAVDKGLITSEVADSMSESDALRLIFKSGVSTSQIVSRISGHGLGMSIVADKVASLTGSIDTNTEQGKGTRFTITLPRMLALFKGIRVRVAGRQFLIPTSSIQKAMRVQRNELFFPAARPCLVFDDKQLPVLSLDAVLGVQRSPGADQVDTFNVLIVNAGAQLVALVVDDVLGEEEGVIKPFDEGLGANRFFSGVLVLGDASIVPVLKPGLLSSQDSVARTSIADKKVIRLLIAEDSLTVRNMLRTMLELAGFAVTTAVNGIEALQMSQRETFDAVVSDIEMPGMNGFELTKSLRSMSGFENLPIILVTSLESDDDRRRGLEAGASAYIVKSNFEQGNLIETINRLVV